MRQLSWAGTKVPAKQWFYGPALAFYTSEKKNSRKIFFFCLFALSSSKKKTIWLVAGSDRRHPFLHECGRESTPEAFRTRGGAEKQSKHNWPPIALKKQKLSRGNRVLITLGVVPGTHPFKRKISLWATKEISVWIQRLLNSQQMREAVSCLRLRNIWWNYTCRRDFLAPILKSKSGRRKQAATQWLYRDSLQLQLNAWKYDVSPRWTQCFTRVDCACDFTENRNVAGPPVHWVTSAHLAS